jgi:hypothetical protein
VRAPNGLREPHDRRLGGVSYRRVTVDVRATVEGVVAIHPVLGVDCIIPAFSKEVVCTAAAYVLEEDLDEWPGAYHRQAQVVHSGTM